MTTPGKKRNLSSYEAAAKALAGINKDMAALKKFANAPYLGAFNELANTMKQYRHQQLEMSQAWMSSVRDSVAYLTDISTSRQHIFDIFDQTGIALDSLNQIHGSWAEQIGGVTAYQSQLDDYVKLSLGENILKLAASETLLAGIDFDSLKNQRDLPLSSITAMEQSIFDFAASYRALAESIPDISELVQIPSFVLPGATYDLYTTGYALRALDLLDGDEDEEIEADASLVSVEYVENLDIVDLLNQVDPALVPMYSGACEDLYGGNPDRKRHVLVSLRELWIHLLDSIAPVGEVKDWIWKHGTLDDIDKNCRPKRHAKIRYILRGVNQKPLKDFVQDDATTFENLYQLYNKLHGKTPNLTEPQLLAIFRKTEAFLAYVIQIWLFAAT